MSTCSCKVIVQLLIPEDRRELQITRLVFSCDQFKKKKKKFEGDTEGGASGFNRDLIALSLKFPRCSAFSFFLTVLSELMPHFTFSLIKLFSFFL